MNEKIVGGKAYNLDILTKNGINIPKWFVVNSADDNFEIDENKLYAVRSSAVGEDGSEKSFAGQMDSYLYVKPQEIKARIQDVIDSANSERIKFYREQNNISDDIKVCVIIQEMINSDVSGVVFSSNPITGKRNEIVISSVFGLGEGLVSGELNADTYTIENDNITKNIIEKPYKIIFDKEKGSGTKQIKNEIPTAQTLTDKQIKELVKKTKEIVDIYGKPQDIEWAYENGILYILQTRPITTLENIPDKSQQEVIWDNSNIIESYSGVTTPLTFSFIKDVYTEVYKQFLLIMGVEQELIEENADIFQMLGLIEGRVYYNLLNWYKLLRLMPGYEINAGFMESMMGVKQKLEQIPKVKPSKKNKYVRLFNLLKSLIFNLFTLPKEIEKFYKHIDITLSPYENGKLKGKSPNELIEIYFELESKLMKKWQAPLVNDFYAMIFYGLLKKSLLKVDSNGTLQNDLLTGETGIISTEPIKRIKQISNKICKGEKVDDEIKEFIKKFGNRCIGELKLETITYKQDPSLLQFIINSYVKQGIIDIEKESQREQEIRRNAEKAAKEKIKNPFFGFILKNARLRVKNRENLRFERTRLFGLVREIFLELGKNFAYENIIETQRDIFYLTKEEIFNYVCGTSVDIDLKTIIKNRKEEYEIFKEKNLPDRFTTYGTVYKANQFIADNIATNIKGDLSGIGACAGIVRAKVKIVHSVEESEGLENCIMVAERTDPGWVPLFPISKGILVERGSILSHSAIVAREMGIPAIVGVNNLLSTLKDGDEVEMDGSTGKIRIIQNEQRN